MTSVILVTYNSMAVLPNCIQSLERCTSASSLELIIADNGSADGTLEWIDEYITRDESPFTRMELIKLEENRGYAYANNRAIQCATEDVILLLNPDTVVGMDAIQKCAERLELDPTIGAVGCRLELEDGSLDRACKRSFPTFWNSFTRFTGLSIAFPNCKWLSKYNLSYLEANSVYPVDCLCGAFMMVSGRVCEVVGVLDEDYFMYGEDIDWCYRIKKAGYEVWYDGTVSTLHLKGGNGGKHSRQSLKYFYDTMYLYYTKTHSGKSRTWVTVMLRLILKVMYAGHATVKGLIFH